MDLNWKRVFIFVFLFSGFLLYILLKGFGGNLGYNEESENVFFKKRVVVRDKQIQSKFNSYKILFVGDTMLARSIGEGIESGQNPFEYIQSEFDKHDLVVANLETVVSEPGIGNRNAQKLYTFNAPVESLSVLKDSGIEVVSLANNHTMDYGTLGLKNMMSLLEEEEIRYFGVGLDQEDAFKPEFVQLNGIEIAFVGINNVELYYNKVGENSAGSAYFNERLIKNSLNEAGRADLVVVMPHWGWEYATEHNEMQEEWGKYFIDNGADLVIGNHAHVVQEYEEYEGKMIYYSLGNFVFDGFNSRPNCKKSIMVSVEINEEIYGESREVKINKVEVIEVLITEKGYPKVN